MFNFKENRITTGLRLTKKAFGDYKWQIIILIVLGFVGGILEGLGINAVIPLFSFIMAGSNQPTDFVSQLIAKIFNFLHITYSLKYLLIFIAVLFTLKAVAWFLSHYTADKIRVIYARKTREKIFRLTLKANWQYLNKQKMGYLEKVLINDINAGASLLSYMSSLTILLTNMIVYIIIAINISLEITLLALAIGGIVFLIFKPLAYKTKKLSYESSNAMKGVAHQINESMLGIKTIKAMALEDVVAESGQKYFQKLQDLEIRQSFLANIAYAAIQPIGLLLILSIFAFSYKTAAFNFASFAVIVYAINKIFTYIQSGQSQLQSIAALYPFLRVALSYQEAAEKNIEDLGEHKKIDWQSRIEIKNLSFAYNKERKALTAINMSIPFGQTVGIVGPSGSGKTTLVDLLLGLIKPDSGEITIGGVNINEAGPEMWRKNIGYVAQDIFLANDSIKNNISFYEEQITEQQIREAAKMANIFDFVETLENKWETMVGERGMELSGGQRQRIILARALARKPKILILDEATSALDNESEALIQKSIQALHDQITVIIIAHRPTTVLNADNLLVIQEGEIVEEGAPKELIERKDSYFSKVYHS
ncbi:MAG TPA: ABC transporter ATP-binding protein [bacterium]|nr:ABC transporter ATP-binding protein [bacterium]